MEITKESAEQIIKVTSHEMSVLAQQDADLDAAYKESKEQLRATYDRTKNAHDMAVAFLDWTSYDDNKEVEQNGSNGTNGSKA